MKSIEGMTQKEMYLELLSRTSEISTIKQQVGITSKILTGNCDPEAGLFSKFQSLKDCVDHHHEQYHPTKEEMAEIVRQEIQEAFPKRAKINKDTHPLEKLGFLFRLKFVQIILTAVAIILAGWLFKQYPDEAQSTKDFIKDTQQEQK